MSDALKPALDCVIDVSHSNGQIDWPSVDPAIVLVFIKASQGSHFHDPMFEKNLAGCLDTGRMVVPYHFLDNSDPDAQIKNFEAHLQQGKPLALDWEGRSAHTAIAEDVEYIGMQIADDMGASQIVGYWGITGSSPGEPTEIMKTWTLWTPRYRLSEAQSFEEVEQAGFGGLVRSLFWQYTEHGRVAGVLGDVDRSIWRGTLDELKAWYNSGSTASS